MKRYIRCSVDLGTFNQYYNVVDDATVDEIFGDDASESPAEALKGYNAKHVAWALAKPEYEDALMESQLDLLEYVQEGTGKPFLAYVVKDRLYPVDEAEIRKALGDN